MLTPGVPLVTIDERLDDAVAGKGFDVRHIARFDQIERFGYNVS